MSRVTPTLSPRQTTLMIAGLSSLGPFAIDTYLPAFHAIALDLNTTDLKVQQTLTAYVVSFAFMNLWHGALSDSIGRKPVVLGTLVLFALTCLGAATSQSIDQLWAWRAAQGLVGGAGMIIGRAIIRDLFDGSDAQRQISNVMMIFSLAPVIAPIAGGFIYAGFGWRAIFIFLSLYASVLAAALWWLMPETLPASQRQSLRPMNLLRGYRTIFSSPVFWRTSLALTLFFQGFFLYILGSPVFGRIHLGLEPTEFAWIFVPGVVGTIVGSAISSRMAGRFSLGRAIGFGVGLMLLAATGNVIMNWFWPPGLPWAVMHLPIYTLGLALAMASLQVRLLDLMPSRRGMVTSCHGCLQSTLIGINAGLLVPLLWGSTLLMALGMLCCTAGAILLYGNWIRNHPNHVVLSSTGAG